MQETVPGVPLSTIEHDLGQEDVQAVWRQVGAFLRQLQTRVAPWFGVPDGSERFADWRSMVAHDVDGLIRDMERWNLVPAPFHTLAGLVERHWDLLALVERPRVVHSDLTARHLFVDRDASGAWVISGVIDWEYGRYADPGSEGLVLDMLVRPEQDPVRKAFLEGYGVVDLSDAAVVRRAIYRGVAHGWAVTDAVRCDDSEGRDLNLERFRRWGDQHRCLDEG